MTDENTTSTAAKTTTAAKKTTTTNVVEKKKVAKMATNSSNVRFVIITEGQGGANIGRVLAANLPNNPYIIALNTSNQDLDDLKSKGFTDDQLFKIGGVSANGAGKNRNTAKLYYKNFKAEDANKPGKAYDLMTTFIGYYEEVLFNPEQQTIIITVFSSDGGTGSGIGPMFTMGLTNFVNTTKSFVYGGKEYEIDDATNAVPRPVVIGLTPKCAIGDRTAANIQNTRECFLDIQTCVDRGIGHFFIADNNLYDVKYNSTEEMYKIINARIVAPFVKFLGIEMNSSIKCMDLQDKINSLRISGCSSFMSVTKQNMYQYIVPHGQSVTRTIATIRYDPEDSGAAEEQKVNEFLKNLDITSVDYMPVFFDVEKSGISSDSISTDLINSSMIILIGWKSLSAVVEDLSDQLKRIESTNDKKATIVSNSARGFDTIKDDGAELASRFGTKTIDQSSINDLF